MQNLVGVRQITHLDRNQVVRLMKQLREEDPNIKEPGRGKYARYEYVINGVS